MIAIAAIAGGTALQLYGQYKDSKARSSAYARQAQIEEMRVSELLERNDINNSILAIEGNRAASTVMAMGPSSMDTAGALENLARDITKQSELNTRDAEFEANMMRLGAQDKRQAAKDERSAGRIRMASTILQQAGSAGMNYA
jgi:hypothetical protein